MAKRPGRRWGQDERGFACYQTDLMLVIAIIGIVAAIAIPKFAQLIRKSSEGASKGNLGMIRSAVSIYYGDLEGEYPTDLSALIAAGKYMAELPKAKTPNYHADSAEVTLVWSFGELTDQGGWAYAGDPLSPSSGTVWVNCTHTDSKGSAWSVY